MTSDQLRQQRSELLALLSGGVLSVSHSDGSRTDFQTAADIRQAIDRIDQEIAAIESPAANNNRTFVVRTSRGL